MDSGSRYGDLPDGVDDPYAVLGVEKRASKKTIRSAYRAKALILHPDKNPDDKSAEEKFKLLCKAYEFLKDEKRRTGYDDWLKRAEKKKEVFAKFDAEKRRFAEELQRREAVSSNKSSGRQGEKKRSTTSVDAKIKRLRKENEEFLKQMHGELNRDAKKSEVPQSNTAPRKTDEENDPSSDSMNFSESFEADILRQMGEMQ
eukprot:Selendium_serpulae@DN5231_c0_g1_i2.p1